MALSNNIMRLCFDVKENVNLKAKINVNFFSLAFMADKLRRVEQSE